MSVLQNSSIDLDVFYKKQDIPNIALGDKVKIVIYLALPKEGSNKEKERIQAFEGIIISTHILEEVEAVCSRTIIISSGKVLLNKETKDILKNKKENLDSIFRKITK